jgi:thiamine pyrophosphate-dependent acetolactate synthase large subunit-like protein
MTRDEAMEIVVRAAKEAGAAVFSGNGYNPRTLCAVEDRPEFFYMVGSMGLCPALAAGFSHCAEGVPVVLVEGDGNGLMGFSGWPTATAAARGTFVHVLLDNALYESTGKQRTLSPEVDFRVLANGAGYGPARGVEDPTSFEAELRTALEGGGKTFLYAPTEELQGEPAPRVPYHPREISQRFRAASAGLVREADTRAVSTAEA